MSSTSSIDFAAPAELYASTGSRARNARLSYQRFDTSAAAIKFAIEELAKEQLYGTVLEVAEQRFDAGVIRQFYDSVEFPLARRSHPVL